MSALEEDRDFLLRSLEDLEREREAGDIDEADYLALKDDYTARAASVLRALSADPPPDAAPVPPQPGMGDGATPAAGDVDGGGGGGGGGPRLRRAAAAGAGRAVPGHVDGDGGGPRLRQGVAADGAATAADLDGAGGGGPQARQGAAGAPAVDVVVDGGGGGPQARRRAAAGGRAVAGDVEVAGGGGGPQARRRAAAGGRAVAGAGGGAAMVARRWRPVAVGAALVVFACVAGVLVARSAGERLPGDPATGEIAATGPSSEIADELAAARDLIGEGRTLDAIKAYDRILERDAEQPEALAYRGWLLRLAGKAAGDPALVDKGMEFIERAVAADPGYPDARFFRAFVNYQDRGNPAAAVPDLRAYLAGESPREMRPVVEDLLRRALADVERGGPSPAPVPAPSPAPSG